MLAARAGTLYHQSIPLHLGTKHLGRGDEVVRLDSLNGYYEVSLNEARLALLQRPRAFASSRWILQTEGASPTCLHGKSIRA